MALFGGVSVRGGGVFVTAAGSGWGGGERVLRASIAQRSGQDVLRAHACAFQNGAPERHRWAFDSADNICVVFVVVLRDVDTYYNTVDL